MPVLRQRKPSQREREAEYKRIQRAKMRIRLDKRCWSADNEGGAELPDKITIERKNGQWVARAKGRCKIGNSPDEAMQRLLVAMRLRWPTPEETHHLAQLYASSCGPSCDVGDFRIKPDLDGMAHYLVDFTSNMKLNRGDFEQALCMGLRGGVGDIGETHETDGCESLGSLLG